VRDAKPQTIETMHRRTVPYERFERVRAAAKTAYLYVAIRHEPAAKRFQTHSHRLNLKAIE